MLSPDTNHSQREPLLKRVVTTLAEALILPLLGLYRFAVSFAPSRKEAIFQSYSQTLSLLPGLSGVFLRRAFYRFTVLRCPRNCFIGFGTVLATPEVEIGNHVYIGVRCMLGHVTIGDDVLIGSNVDVLSGKHQHRIDRLDTPIRLQGGTYARVRIGRDAWIGNGATIIEDVGEQAVVAAGSVVVKPVPPRAVVGGNPAKLLHHRSDQPGSAHDAARRTMTTAVFP